MQEKHTKYKN